MYDFTPESCDLQGWLTYMEEWAEQVGIPWETMGGTGSKKLIQFKNGKRKLEKNGFVNIEGFSIDGGVSEPGTTANWQTAAYFYPVDNYLYFCFLEDIVDFTKPELQPIIQHLLKFTGSKYGIAYQREYLKGPYWYALGVIGTAGKIEIPKSESELISKWRIEYRHSDGDYYTGLLRDVYPYNLLTEAHLQQKVNGANLEQWINKTPQHGTLDRITDQHWLWSVPSDYIPVIQKELYPSGLLLCYKP